MDFKYLPDHLKHCLFFKLKNTVLEREEGKRMREKRRKKQGRKRKNRREWERKKGKR